MMGPPGVAANALQGAPVRDLPHTTAVVQAAQECQLIAGPVAISAQLVLLLVVLSALSVKRWALSVAAKPAHTARQAFSGYNKDIVMLAAMFLVFANVLLVLASPCRHRERPRRALNVWLLDIGKQGCSAGAGHTVGMVIAIVVHSRSGLASECAWYLVVYCLDATLGLTLAITFHKMTTGIARWCHVRYLSRQEVTEGSPMPWWDALVEIGHYGDAATPNMRKWGIQVFFWVLCVITARSIVGVLILSLVNVFTEVTTFMDSKFVGRPHLYLYTVMVCIPLVVNIGQAWIQDQVLKWKHKATVKRDDEEEFKVLNSAEGGLITQLLTPNTQRAR